MAEIGTKCESILTAIDIGSAKTWRSPSRSRMLVCAIAGHGITESRGSRKGVIVDLEKAVGSVKKAVEDARTWREAPLESAVVGVSGAHIRGVNSQGGISLGSRAREIAREDFSLAVEQRTQHSASRRSRSRYICCHRNSFSTADGACAIPRAWSDANWKCGFTWSPPPRARRRMS